MESFQKLRNEVVLLNNIASIKFFLKTATKTSLKNRRSFHWNSKDNQTKKNIFIIAQQVSFEKHSIENYFHFKNGPKVTSLTEPDLTWPDLTFFPLFIKGPILRNNRWILRDFFLNLSPKLQLLKNLKNLNWTSYTTKLKMKIVTGQNYWSKIFLTSLSFNSLR